MSTIPRTAAVALALVALAAGCGGGGDEKDASDTTVPALETSSTLPGETTTTGPAVAADATTTVKPGTPATRPGGTASTAGAAGGPTTTRKPTAPPNDVGTARGFLLTQPDLGAGYEKTDRDATGSGELDTERCGRGNPVFAKDNPNQFEGEAFSKGQGFDTVVAGSGSVIAASTTQATEAMAIVKSDEFLRCIEEEAKAQAAKSAPPGTTFDVKASRRPLTGADEATNIHIVFTGTYGTTKFSGDIDVFAYRKAKFLVLATAALFGTTNAGEPARIAEVQRKKIG